VKSFKCLNCAKRSRVAHVKVEASQEFLICTWCGAEHLYRRSNSASNVGIEDVVIVGLRSLKPHWLHTDT
jgi:transcription elongation factor Elf1